MQGTDLHSSTFNQALAAEYISGGFLAQHLPKIINLYRPKQEIMLSALEKYFPLDFKWSRPEGGMFIWAEGPESFDRETLCWKAVVKKVAYVPGRYFYTSRGEGIGTMRLNFTKTDEETIDRAVKMISEVIKREM
jgi:2-aminoadipate transaminase